MVSKKMSEVKEHYTDRTRMGVELIQNIAVRRWQASQKEGRKVG